MRNIIYIIGLVVIVLLVLRFAFGAILLQHAFCVI